ncbi:TonB-dependent receptor plug [Candidatus Sulfotelmatomonas gaucii]|uniref:TonB-dependent receptor plug n=1 Tax=Candidatus Sulfuritelmatomonas gaucii TaxID=2043161 RepID=A0A2N9LPS4_9BACT|nr:TonB-dependent receptor plug [Candidatus Sulfotelmatomonas gaucii]
MRQAQQQISGTRTGGTQSRFFHFAAWSCAALLIAILLPSLGANAQLTGKGAITGTVTDSTGAVIPGADIAAMNDANGITTKTVSTSAGDYHFADLDPGIYTVTSTAKGFKTVVQKNIHVNAMESQAYNPMLPVAAAGMETITVSSAPPQLETSNAALGSTMEQETYSELPIEMGAYGSPDQRRATDFAYLMPGVQGNETNGNATTNTGVVNGSGSRGAASDVYVDGVPFVRAGGNGDPRYVWTAISVDAVEQFQVQTNGYSAAYEGQGVMNYTVKQGGSQQHGSIYEFFRNTALDTWGFFGKAPNPATGVPVKPVEHSNEYGVVLSGPLVPFGSWKQKVFYFGNYDGFRYSSANPTPITFPNAAEQGGDFSAYLGLSTPIKIYDPSSQAACTANSTDGFCRYQYGYGPGTGTGPAGNPKLTGTANVIPSSQFSTIAKNMQALLPKTGIGTGLQSNYIAPNQTGLSNWTTTDRIDYLVTSRDTLSFIAAIGRQASSNPVGQTTAGRNVGPVPFNYGQTYAPKTAVGIIEETHIFTPNLLNQVKWGYARYNGPTFNPNQAAAYAATAMGIGGLPAGQAQQTFPIVTFAGSNPPTNWGGTTANVTLAENYTALDAVQWNVGKHSFTFGGQVAWMLYNTISATGGTTPITLAASNTETAGISKGSYTVAANTGVAYASMLIGQIDKGSFTDYSLHPEYGARFRAISPYVQDDWKLNSKLTVNLGLRYDFFPTVTEVHNDASFFSPSLANPVTGLNGALAFTGHGSNTCNCATPVNNFYKNFGPRLGLAFQLDSKTVIRASYGVMFSHGDAVGGLASTIGTLGYAASPSFSSTNDQTVMPGLEAGGNGAIPTYTPATGVSSGAAYGTGFTKTSGYTGTPSAMTYDDPYLGSRAPEYINWSFGIQRQITNSMALTASYVGAEGHFEQTDSLTGRGFASDALDPQYLTLGPRLADTGTTATTVTADCSTYNLTCPGLSNYATNQPLSTILKPFPYQSVSDSFGYIGNSNYHALQAMLSTRTWHGLTFNANYAYSRIIDDGGTFRTGYPIPAGTLANHPSASYPADRIERTVSTSNQPQHFVATSVWDWAFGKTVLAENAVERAILGGFAFSGIFQTFSGSPLAVTASACQTNPALAQSSSSCAPTLNPNYTGTVRQNGKWGDGATWANFASTSYIVPSTGTSPGTVTGPFINPVSTVLNTTAAPAYTFGDSPRTAPYGLSGPGYYQLDLGLVRSFPLHITEATKLEFRADWYNITNHTQFSVASTVLGNSTFGTVTASPTLMRKSAQFSARISF